jgi:hypothetical protein
MKPFTKPQIVDKIVTSDVWMLRAFNKLLAEELVLEVDKLWFDEIKIRLDNDSSNIPDIVKNIIRFKLVSSYLDDIVNFANGG